MEVIQRLQRAFQDGRDGRFNPTEVVVELDDATSPSSPPSPFFGFPSFSIELSCTFPLHEIQHRPAFQYGITTHKLDPSMNEQWYLTSLDANKDALPLAFLVGSSRYGLDLQIHT